MEAFYTFVYPYFENPLMLAAHVENWNCYPEDLRSRIRLILIDDCSRRSPAEPVFRRCQLQKELYRIRTNIPWNQHGARNLGAAVAPQRECLDPWMFMCDIDMMLTAEMATRLLATNHNPHNNYTFARSYPKHPHLDRYHVNMFSVRHSVYWQVGGYDEDYCGLYGGDVPFLQQLRRISPRVHLDSVALIAHLPSDIADANTQDYSRTGPSRKSYLTLLKRKQLLGQKRPRNPLRFCWERILWRLPGQRHLRDA